MTEFQEIIKLRNAGKLQEEIAELIGISLRTVQRYLKTGKIPVYNRTKPCKKDPFSEYSDLVAKIFKDKEVVLKPRSQDIYRHLVKLGYKGSLRTVSRKTKELRASIKKKEIYFEQSVPAGKMAEGDFTGIEVPFISGLVKKQLWVVTLKNSKGSFAKSFDNQTFESFAQGTVDSFKYFGGVPEIYRLDNLKPVVKKILNSYRTTTIKFNELLAHYGFKASFCNPGKGNEKGSVESINRHFKDYLYYAMSLDKKMFIDDAEWENYVSLKLEEYNSPKKEKIESEKVKLQPLPATNFLCFTTEVHSVNKHGFITLSSVRYSIPSEYKYSTLEVRLYCNKIEFFCKGKKIKEHDRKIYNANSKEAAVDFKDHIDELLKKPGAFTFYKYKDSCFPSDTFKELYNSYPDNRNYLECLQLCKLETVSVVETAISLLLYNNKQPTRLEIMNLIHPKIKHANYDISYLDPLEPSLDCYDQIMFQAKKGGELCAQRQH